MSVVCPQIWRVGAKFYTIVLKRALDNTEDSTDAVRILRMLKHEGRMVELEEAKKAAALRSGTRGMKARKELKALEVVVAEEEAQ